MKKLTTSTLTLAASVLLYQACSDEDVAPARTFSDGGAATVDGSTSSGSDAGGTVGTDGGTVGTDSSTPPPPPPPKDAGKDAAKDAKTDAPTDGATDAPNDAGPADAGVDARAADCTAYCTCMGTNCPGTLDDAGIATCQTTCEAQTTWDLACRTTHCGLAASDPGTHCPHAVGVSVCQ
ncbi:MAG: hypothetical protein U0235_29945 [Polyangiaceae bacterium]